MDAKTEFKIKGRAVSRGTAIGTVTCLYGTKRQFFHRNINTSEIDAQRKRVSIAIADAGRKLGAEIESVHLKPVVDEVLNTHLLFLTDPSLESRITTLVGEEHINAEWAVKLASEEVVSRLADHNDDHLREKRLDIEDVCDRILSELGMAESQIVLPENGIIAAEEISPAMLLRLSNAGLVGMISESGGWTSHTSILARELGIPAVTGIPDLFELASNGTEVIVNGYSGEIVFHPSRQTVAGFQHARITDVDDLPSGSGSKYFSTIDGHKVLVRTNTNSVDGYVSASKAGAIGIGLFRSETLIDANGKIPDEDQQFAVYSEIAENVGSAGVHIRTFDLEAAQFELTSSIRQKNPALGLRAIRLSLENVALLNDQVRAILRAAFDRSIGLIVPMVSSVNDVEAVKRIIAKQSAELTKIGVNVGQLQVGAMIEVPSSVLIVDQLTACCDFLCLGTNDLAQYLLAADRDNEAVSKWFRTLHPAMLRAVRRVIDDCVKTHTPLVICGEMAGSPFYVPILIGLGATELSMNPSSIPAVTRVISGIAFEDAQDLVRSLESVTDPDVMEDIVINVAKEKWTDLFAPGFLDLHRT